MGNEMSGEDGQGGVGQPGVGQGAGGQLYAAQGHPNTHHQQQQHHHHDMNQVLLAHTYSVCDAHCVRVFSHTHNPIAHTR